jgi:hypothetical protein
MVYINLSGLSGLTDYFENINLSDIESAPTGDPHDHPIWYGILV